MAIRHPWKAAPPPRGTIRPNYYGSTPRDNGDDDDDDDSDERTTTSAAVPPPEVRDEAAAPPPPPSFRRGRSAPVVLLASTAAAMVAAAGVVAFYRIRGGTPAEVSAASAASVIPFERVSWSEYGHLANDIANPDLFDKSLLGGSAAVEVPAEVFPGVHLPEGEAPMPIEYPHVRSKVFEFIGPASQAVPSALLGRPKSTSLQVAHDLLTRSQKLDAQISNPEDYKFFGNGKHAENLVYLLKTNPFMATTLTERPGGFILKTFDPKDPDNKDSPSLYRKILGTLDGTGHRVNVYFNSKMDITSIRVYDDILKERNDKKQDKKQGHKSSKGKKKETQQGKEQGMTVVTASDTDYWASSVTYNLIFYASCVHATIHVLHYLLTAALDHSSEEFDAMNDWAKMYSTNIPAKYIEVGQSLISDQPEILALLGINFAAVPSSLFATFAILTGSSGFGASGIRLRPILQDMLDEWGKNPSYWLESMMNISAKKMEAAGILTEFKKHHDLIQPFAADTANALLEIDEDKYTATELRLKDYLKRCGSFASNIETLEQWIELMSVTGIVHGSTLSYTRVFGTAGVLRWRDIQSEVWETADMNILLKGLVTLCGMDEHRHAMTSATDSPTETYAPELQDVLDKYDTKVSSLKEAYKAEIMSDNEEFNDYGWILTDFCPDGFDGKQLTIAAYI